LANSPNFEEIVTSSNTDGSPLVFPNFTTPPVAGEIIIISLGERTGANPFTGAAGYGQTWNTVSWRQDDRGQCGTGFTWALVADPVTAEEMTISPAAGKPCIGTAYRVSNGGTITSIVSASSPGIDNQDVLIDVTPTESLSLMFMIASHRASTYTNPAAHDLVRHTSLNGSGGDVVSHSVVEYTPDTVADQEDRIGQAGTISSSRDHCEIGFAITPAAPSGPPPAELTITPDPVNIGAVDIGSETTFTVSVENTGTVDAFITAINTPFSKQPDYRIEIVNLPSSLIEPGESFDLDCIFHAMGVLDFTSSRINIGILANTSPEETIFELTGSINAGTKILEYIIDVSQTGVDFDYSALYTAWVARASETGLVRFRVRSKGNADVVTGTQTVANGDREIVPYDKNQRATAEFDLNRYYYNKQINWASSDTAARSIIFDGVQFLASESITGHILIPNGFIYGKVITKNCHFKAAGEGTAYRIDADVISSFVNNIINGYTVGLDASSNFITGDNAVYNNTLVGPAVGLNVQGAGNWHIRNNLFIDTPTNAIVDGGGTIAKNTNNVSSGTGLLEGGGIENANILTFATDKFWLVSDPANDAVNNAFDLRTDPTFPVTRDIDGLARQAVPDVGAHEIPGKGVAKTISAPLSILNDEDFSLFEMFDSTTNRIIAMYARNYSEKSYKIVITTTQGTVEDIVAGGESRYLILNTRRIVNTF
jgi:hypothetical protein